MAERVPNIDRTGDRHHDERKMLAVEGFDIWMDRIDLEPGDDWNRRISEALKASIACIICVTETWLKRLNAGGYVRTELAFANTLLKKREKFLLPVLCGPVKLKQLPDDLRVWQVVDILKDRRRRVSHSSKR
jgi:hypothetical protein